MLMGFLVFESILLLLGLAMLVRPKTANLIQRRIMCTLRLGRRESLDRPIPKWRNAATAVIGVAVIAFVISDWSGLRICRLDADVKTATSGSLSPEMIKQVDDLVVPGIESGDHVGMVVGIINGGRIWTRGYGRRSTGSDDPPDGDSVFEIGSITKTFTSTALAVMSIRGRVRLDDSVGRYLPSSVRVPEHGAKQITLESLAMHTSGLPRVADNMGLFSDFSGDPYAGYRDEQLYEFLNTHKLRRSPGTEHEYSNLGMGLLGLALCRKAGAGYEQMVTGLVCKPLGLRDTTVTLSDSQRVRLVQGYAIQERVGNVMIAVPSENWSFQDCTAGAGALKSTANDMLRYLKANMAAPGNELGQALQTLHTPRLKIDDVEGVGLGWFMLSVPWADEPVIWHNGGTGGYRSFVGFCKKRKLGVVVLANSSTDVDVTALRILKAMIGRNGQ